MPRTNTAGVRPSTSYTPGAALPRRQENAKRQDPLAPFPENSTYFQRLASNSALAQQLHGLAAMDQGLLIAAAGMRAQIETLELLGNNLANTGTAGFKGDREFFRLFQTARTRADPNTAEIRWMPVVQGSAIDFEQGPLQRTEGPLDVALAGPGFLTVETAAGSRLYTRNGAFHLSTTGRLETADGHAVLDSGASEITIPPGTEIQISERGMLRAGGLNVAQLSVVSFEGRPLMKAGNSYFQAPEGTQTQPAPETAVQQGYLEGSNVNVPLAAVQMIQTSRNFEMLSRIASLVADEMNGRSVEQLGSLR
jgi:flagellar basal body rod protein FlgG